jgi:hypothetical protein
MFQRLVEWCWRLRNTGRGLGEILMSQREIIRESDDSDATKAEIVRERP